MTAPKDNSASPPVLLALDLGTSCGWCVRSAAGCDSGVWNLKGGRFEGGGMRFVRFRKYVREVIDSAGVCRVAFEEVRRHMGVDAAHVYGGLLAVLSEECEVRKIPYEGIPVATIKKKATGKGNADKAAMIAAARARWPHLQIEDDNQADAMWIAEVAA